MRKWIRRGLILLGLAVLAVCCAGALERGMGPD